MKTLFFILAILVSCSMTIRVNKSKGGICDNAKEYSVTAWAGGSVVKYDGKCYRARTVGAAGHQVPWDNSTYNDISGWDEIESDSSENECSHIHPKCKKCEDDVCTKYINDFVPNCYEDVPCENLHFKCTKCKNNKCVKCQKGWEPFEGQCKRKIECKDWDKNCIECDEEECLSCKDGFKLDSDNSRCIKQEDKCKDVNEWSSDIAFGRKAPWTYSSGQIVKYNGKKYKANWGGQETPGDKKCSSESDCRNQGIQWVLIENC